MADFSIRSPGCKLQQQSILAQDCGIEELKTSEKLESPERLRAHGGGRKKVEIKYPGIIGDIEKIMDENTAGDPVSLLKWTNK